MKAVQVMGEVSSPKIIINTSLPKPKPKNSEILVRVHAAGVTGDEILWPELYETATRIPGHEISGVISEMGSNYDGSLEVGQEVFAFIAANRGEGQADYVICLPDEVTLKPASTSHHEASALPIPLLTAWEAIVDHGKIEPDMKVLITGASGAVGSLAVQLATQLASARVVALAACRHCDMLRGLGAQEVVDYNSPDWEHQLKDVDVVIDTVGGDVLTKTWETLKADGFIITVGDPAPPWAFGRCEPQESTNHPKVRYIYFIVSPSGKRLSKAAKLVDDGSVKPLAVARFPFQKAEEAWAHAGQRNRQGKVTIDFIGHDLSKSSGVGHGDTAHI